MLLGIASIASAEMIGPEDAEYVEIAQKFVERIFADIDNVPLGQFEITDAMKEYIASDTFKLWVEKIATDYDKPGDCDKIEVVQHDQASRSVYLFFSSGYYPVKMWVTFQDKAITGFHYDVWQEKAAKQNAHIAGRQMKNLEILVLVIYMVVYSVFVMPVLMFLVVYYGEKWRVRRVEEQNQYLEPFDVNRTFGTIYYESQCPLWCRLFLLVSLSPLLFIPFIALAALNATLASLGFILLIGFLLDGLYIRVNEESVAVKWGGLRCRVLRIPFDSIVSADVITFSPIGDFMGWGIKRGRIKTVGNVHGYFMSGTRGVLFQTEDGKKYLLGSDTPERLVAVICSRTGERRSTG